MKLCIQAVDSSKKPVFEFAGPSIVIGRDAGCDLPMTGTSNVSGQHSEITLEADGAFLADLQSTNGTFLNDRRIDAPKKLRKGDYFRLGQTGPCFQIMELDLASAAPASLKGSTLPEKVPGRAAAQERDLEYFARAEMAPAAKVKPKAAPKEELPPASDRMQAPVAAPGQTRLMVLSLQKANQKLMIGAALAILALVVVGGAIGFHFYTKTRDLSSQTADLDDSAKKMREQQEGLNQTVEKVSTNVDKVSTNVDKVAKGVEKVSGQEVADHLRKSTVWVNSSGGSGSGMLVNAEDKIVITNYHVVAHPKLARLMNDLQGQLNDADFNKDLKLHFKDIPVKLPAKMIHVNMQSDQFACKFQVLEVKGKELRLLAASDDKARGRNAHAVFPAPHEGDYVIMVMTGNGALGNFRLTVSLYVQDVDPFVMVNFPEYADGKVIAEKGHYLNLLKTDAAKYKAKVIAWSDTKDLAILKLNYVPEGIPAVPLAKESARSGQEVHSVGNPGGSQSLWVYTFGKVRTADPFQSKFLTRGGDLLFYVDAWVIETQSPTNEGDSGGPMVNDRGELVAVTQSGNNNASLISTFIDIREVRALLKSNNLR